MKKSLGSDGNIVTELLKVVVKRGAATSIHKERDDYMDHPEDDIPSNTGLPNLHLFTKAIK